MDGRAFEVLLQRLTTVRSRRGAVVGLLGGGLGLLGIAESEAKKHKKHKKKKRRAAAPPPPAPASPPPGPTPYADATCGGTGEKLTGYREAQTFLALRNGQLTNATVFLESNVGDDTLDIEIWSVDEAGVPNARLARVALTNIPATASPGPRRLDATFATPATVVQGVRYEIGRAH